MRSKKATEVGRKASVGAGSSRYYRQLEPYCGRLNKGGFDKDVVGHQSRSPCFGVPYWIAAKAYPPRLASRAR
ncbi:MAG: hypothetical protein AAFQ89_23815 [Cyanobacteria bacterium J06626_18]